MALCRDIEWNDMSKMLYSIKKLYVIVRYHLTKSLRIQKAL